ncbi:MAG: hypothetical protein DMG60_14545 [Acidobacteria bacterium]|nr:MAG: hypothetical protein DMG60_14545 [Acidobacteriota bacterium]
MQISGQKMRFTGRRSSELAALLDQQVRAGQNAITKNFLAYRGEVGQRTSFLVTVSAMCEGQCAQLRDRVREAWQFFRFEARL